MFQAIRQWIARHYTGVVHSRSVFLLDLRGMFFALLIGIATASLFFYVDNDRIIVGILSFLSVLLVGAAVVGVDLLARNKQITTISAIYFGLLLGFLLGYLLWIPVEPMLTSYLD